MTKDIMKINDSEYAKVLQQAVSEIQTARITIARQVNSTGIATINWTCPCKIW